jgi:arsenate reductase
MWRRALHIFGDNTNDRWNFEKKIYKVKLNSTKKTKVAFICVHNTCRSKIAEALCYTLTTDAFDSYSARTALKTQINQDAIRLMKDIYNIDRE